MTRHILFDATCYNPGAITGAGRLVYEQIEHLARIDHETDYLIFGFAPTIWPAGSLPPNFRYRPIKVRPWLGSLAQETSRRWFVRSHVARFQVDVVHFTLDMVPLYDDRARSLFSLYDLARLSPHFIYSVEQNMRTLVRTRLRYSAARKADLLHTISHYSADTISKRLRVPARRIRVIYPGYDPRLSPGEPDTTVMARYGLESDHFLLFVGEFGRQKNEEGLIKAYLKALDERAFDSSTKLVLIGSTANLQPSTRTLLEHSKFAKSVIMPGRVSDDDLLHLYRGALALVLPSYYEGFGLPALEAMACGTMPIVARATSLPEVIGEAGLIVTPGKNAELSEALSKAVNDHELRQRLSAASLARATQFTYANMAQAMSTLYREMADG